jgi:hypothetical protein
MGFIRARHTSCCIKHIYGRNIYGLMSTIFGFGLGKIEPNLGKKGRRTPKSAPA